MTCASCRVAATIDRFAPAIKNRLHAILAKHGITRHHSDLFGKGGREFLAQVDLRVAPRRRLGSVVSLIELGDREIAETTREIERRAKADDRVEVLTRSVVLDAVPRCRSSPSSARSTGSPTRGACAQWGRAHTDHPQSRWPKPVSPLRRRDPLPGAPQPGEREKRSGRS